MPNALIATSSLPAYERLRDLCEVEHDNPICKVMKAQLSLLANDVSDSLMHLRTFNDLLDVSVEVDQWNNPGKDEAKGEVKNAITTFVWLLRMQLNCKKKRASDGVHKARIAELKAWHEAARTALAGAQRTCSFLVQSAIPLPAAMALGMLDDERNCIEDAKSLRVQEVDTGEPDVESASQGNPLMALIDAVFNSKAKEADAMRRVAEYDDATKEFLSLMPTVITKLDRYADRIGKSVKISEMIRDYAEFLRKVDEKNLKCPSAPSAPHRTVTFRMSSIFDDVMKRVVASIIGVVALCYCFNCLSGFAVRVLIAALVIIGPILAYRCIKLMRDVREDMENLKRRKKIYEEEMRIYQDHKLPEFESQKARIEEVFAQRLNVACKFDQ